MEIGGDGREQICWSQIASCEIYGLDSPRIFVIYERLVADGLGKGRVLTLDNSKSAKKRAAFKRLASQRTTAVLERLRILGNCSNRQLYEYSDEDVRKIFSAIAAEMKAVKTKFSNPAGSEFTLE